jgi:hypothetical protein
MNNLKILQHTPQKPTMTTLSCLNHIKRVLDPDSGELVRPPAPPAYAVIDLTVDRSGSMGSMGRAMYTGVSNFIKVQQETAQISGTLTYFSLTTFDDITDTPYNNINLGETDIDLSEAHLQTILYPRGTTRLVDTMMERLLALQWKIREIVKNMPRKVRMLKPKIVGVFAILTDGEDNESTLWTERDVNQVIKNTKAKGITHLFLGANQDAIRQGAKYGIPDSHAVTFGSTYLSAKAAIRSATQATQRAVTGCGNMGFTPLERLNSAPLHPHTMPTTSRQKLRKYGHSAKMRPFFQRFRQPHFTPAMPPMPPIPTLTRQTTIQAYNFKN